MWSLGCSQARGPAGGRTNRRAASRLGGPGPGQLAAALFIRVRFSRVRVIRVAAAVSQWPDSESRGDRFPGRQVRGPDGAGWQGAGLRPDVSVTWPPGWLLDGPAGPALMGAVAARALDSDAAPRAGIGGGDSDGAAGAGETGRDSDGPTRTAAAGTPARGRSEAQAGDQAGGRRGGRFRCPTFWACGWDSEQEPRAAGPGPGPT